MTYENQRLEQAASRLEISELCSSYSVAIDAQDLDLLADLLADEIRVTSADGKMKAAGKEEVLRLFEQTFAARGPSCHWTHDRIIRFDPADPDSASGLIVAHAETNPNGVPSVTALTYRDEYRRDAAGRWLFASRHLSNFYYTKVEDYAGALAQLKRSIFQEAAAWLKEDQAVRTVER